MIVSILIYEGLKLIRGTRAAQMALGSAVCVVLFTRRSGTRCRR